MKEMKKRRKNILSILMAILITIIAVPISPSMTSEAASKNPAKVTGLKKSKATESAITVKYKKAKRATGYQVRLYSSKGKYIKAVSTKKTSATIKSLMPSTTYKFRVRAYRKLKSGRKTNTYYSGLSKTVKIKTAATKKPGSVSGLKKSKATENAITVTYKKASRASGYQVRLYTSKGKYVKTVTTTKTSASIKSLKPSTTYKFRVRAYRKLKSGRKTNTYYSGLSKTVNIKTAAHKHVWKAHKKLVKAASTEKIYDMLPERKVGGLGSSGLNDITDYAVYRNAGGTMKSNVWFDSYVPEVEYNVYLATNGQTDYLVDSSAYHKMVMNDLPWFEGNTTDGYEAIKLLAPFKVTVRKGAIGLDKNGSPYSYYEWFRKRYDGIYHPEEAKKIMDEYAKDVVGLPPSAVEKWFAENRGKVANYENCYNNFIPMVGGKSISISIPTGQVTKQVVATVKTPAQYKTDYYYCSCGKRK